ncbi:MAG: ribosomal protein S1 [Planctomycetota bacterium]|jgi:ribosomal protein S1
MSDERSLDGEIEAALEGINLQDVGLPNTENPKQSKSGSGGDKNLQTGTIAGVDKTDVIVDLGPRMQGVISIDEFDPAPVVGETYQFTMAGQEDGLWLLSRREALAIAALDEMEVGSNVKAKVTGQNTGGLELRVGGLRGFMPASHASISRIEDLSSLIGQMLVCEVLELDRGKKQLLLSRRNVERAEVEVTRKETVGTMVPGSTVSGKVTRVEGFGAFVDIGGGVEGLLHVSNISRKRVEDVKEVLSPGQVVQVMILDIKEGGKRIGLGMKQLEPDPWDDAVHRYRDDQIVEATVVKVLDFGSFIELEPGLEGLLHISQMGDSGGQRGGRNKGGPGPGDKLTVRIESIDPMERRISLSMLDSRGSKLGSEEAAGASEIENVLRDSSKNIGTNLGSLFKKALERK